MSESACAIVLAGGSSRRMGTDKALLSVGDWPLVTWMSQRLGSLVEHVIVAGPLAYQVLAPTVLVVPDELPGRGPLGGLVSALRQSAHPLCFVIAVDMPLVQPQLVLAMLAEAREHPEADVVALRDDGQWQPLHAVYRSSCLPVAAERLGGADRSLHGLLREVRLHELPTERRDALDPGRLSTRGANTEAEWAVLLEVASRDAVLRRNWPKKS
ncbi:MAG TPA: molybdenum cofactor guanylyltransferase [Ktedonobacterales bacterium]